MPIGHFREGHLARAAEPRHRSLLSGWIIGDHFLKGKAAVLCAHVGKGRVLLYGADVTYRGQPLGTMKMFFHGILTSGRAH